MKSKKTRIFSLVAVAVVIIAMVAYHFYKPSSVGDGPKTEQKSGHGSRGGGGSTVGVTVFMPQVGAISDGNIRIGTLLPNEEVDVASETMGKIVQISFNEGASVKKGQLLAKVDDSDLVAQLKRAQFNLKMVKERLDRQRILLAKDAVSRESFDQVETEYKMLEADIELLEIKIARTRICAPFDGVVGFRYVSIGSYIQPNTKIANLVDNSKLKVEFTVPEKYIFENLKGRKIEFTIEGSAKTYKAEVYAVDPRVDVKTRTITLRALYNNSDKSLAAGMFSKVSMSLSSDLSTALMIPTEAVIPQMEGKTVWVVSGGKAHSVSIETGIRTNDMVEVLSGVTAADSVIITGVMQLREGVDVTINQQ